MRNLWLRGLSAAMVLATLTVASLPAFAGPNKTEEELIAMLKSRDYRKVQDALDRLPNWYPNSTQAIPAIAELLKSNDTIGIDPWGKPLPSNILARKAARSLGNYHATLSPDDLKIVYAFLRARDIDEVLDGLKALRGLNAPDAVAEILPLLKDRNHNILRDSCRTLAVLGNKDTIPAIEPLLNSPMPDVRNDAKAAIAALRSKP